MADRIRTDRIMALDDRHARRLAALGIEPLRRRAANPPAEASPLPAPAANGDTICLLAPVPRSAADAPLLEQVARTLRMAGVSCAIADRDRPRAARTWIAFGDEALARARAWQDALADAALVAVPAVAQLRTDPQAKRALWLTLRRCLHETGVAAG
jgi:DNA polymerase III psi subunit